jgi:coenzyme PQQ precursor peptide PqqA
MDMRAHENHESRIMMLAWRRTARRVHVASGVHQSNKESTMIWETPVAIDLRLGMEITMYAEHR